MPTRYDGLRVCLSGEVTLDDAEPLRELLARHPDAAVDLTACEHLHTSALQLLLAARRAVLSPSGDAFLEKWIVPELAARAETGSPPTR